MARGRSRRSTTKSTTPKVQQQVDTTNSTDSTIVTTTSSGRRTSKSTRYVDTINLTPNNSSTRGRTSKSINNNTSNCSNKKRPPPWEEEEDGDEDEDYNNVIQEEEEDVNEDESSNSSFVVPKSTPRNSRAKRASNRSSNTSGTNNNSRTPASKAAKKPWDESDEDEPVNHHIDEDEDLFAEEEEEEMIEEEDPFKPEFEEDEESDEDEDLPRRKDDEDNDDNDNANMDEDEYSPEGSLDSNQQRPSLRMTIRVPSVPKYLELLDEEVKKTIPELILPESSDDLVLPMTNVSNVTSTEVVSKYQHNSSDGNQLMEIVSIYEILRHFSNILRLSPFRFEDFCTSLMIEEQSALISEIHIQLLKSLIREDEINSTLYVPSDLKDAVQINFLFIDHITWPDVLRLYLSSDMKSNGHLIESCFRGQEYPFVPMVSKVSVLKHLCECFLQTSIPRDDLVNEGIIKHDEICRVCHKLGELLCCESCPAVFHLHCLDPPLENVPTEDWTCPVCRSNSVIGVTDCKSDYEKSGLLSRHEPLGWDRHGRRYWFLVRRIIVEECEGDSNKCWYYSTRLQLEELLEALDEDEYESDLVKSIEEISEELLRQMEITETLTRSLKRGKKTWFEVDNERIKKIQDERKRIEEEAKKLQEDAKKEEIGVTEEEKVVTNGPATDEEPTEGSDVKSEPLADAEMKDEGDIPVDGREESEETDSKPIDTKPVEPERKGILTRLKTGVIQPKPIDLDPYKRMQEANSSGTTNGTNEEVFVPKKDGSGLIRIRRSQLATYDPNYLFKLGQEIHVKPYINLYQTTSIALNKGQQAEEKDKKRHLSHKFSLTPASEFKWVSASGSPLSSAASANFSTRATILSVLRSTIAHLESQFHDCYLHPNWPKHRDSWAKAVKLCETASDFSLAICILESSMKPIVFNAAWNETQLGFTHLQKTTLLEREIRAKTEKRERKEERDENEGMYKFNVHVHYVKKLRHQIWKQKGEEYRLSGKGGWFWKSKTRLSTCTKSTTSTFTSTSTGVRYQKPKPVTILELTDEEIDTVAKEPTININYELRKERRIFYPTIYTGVWNTCNKEDTESTNSDGSIKTSSKFKNQKFINNMKIMEGLLQRRLYQEKYQKAKQQVPKPTPESLKEVKSEPPPTDIKSEPTTTTDTKPEPIETNESESKVPTTTNDLPQYLTKCYSSLCKFNSLTRGVTTDGLTDAMYQCYSAQCIKDQKKAKEIAEERLAKELIEKEVKEKEEQERKKLEEERKKLEEEMKVKEDAEKKLAAERAEIESAINDTHDCRAPVTLGKFSVFENCVTKDQVIRELPKIRERKVITSGAVCPVHRFKTNRGHRRSVLVLPKYELKRLGRLGSFREIWGFNYTCKLNHYIWPYHTTPRPVFRTCWLYRTQRIDTIHAVALQLKNIWASIRWDDLSAKPPVPILDRRTITTENEVITTEILQRREVPPYGLRYEYMIRRIVVPIELPVSKTREKATPIRSGLRERKRAESPQVRGPSVTESWHPEEELELWELKSFAEKLVANKEKERLDRLRGLAPGTDPTSTRRILEDQIRQKMSAEMEKKGQKTILAPNATAKGLLASGNKLVRRNLMSAGVSKTPIPAAHPGFAMIRTTAGQTFKVPMTALQGKQVGQTIIIKTASGNGAPQTTTAATIISIAPPPMTTTPTLTPQVTTSVTTPKPSVSTPNFIIRTTPGQPSTPGSAVTTTSTTPQRIQVVRGPAPTPTTPNAPVTQRVIIQQQPGAPAPGPQAMAQIPVRLPNGQVQMIQIPLSMLNSNQPLQIQLQTPSAIPSGAPITSSVIVSTQPAPQPQTQTIQLISQPTTPQQPPAVRVVGHNPTTGQRLVQIQRPAVPGGQPVIQMQGTPAQNQLLANQINQQLKAGTLQLRLPPVVPGQPSIQTPITPASLGQKIVIQQRPGQVATPTKQIIIHTSPAGISTPPTIRVTNPPPTTTPSLDTSGGPESINDSLIGATTIADNPEAGTIGGTSNFVMTSEMTNEIIKQALMNPNVTPEIQQKLLALQKHNQENPNLVLNTKPVVSTPTSPAKRYNAKKEEPLFPAVPKVPNPAAVARGKASALKRKAAQAAAAAKAAEREQQKALMSTEELEMTNRDETIKSIMKFMVDKIEKDERNELKRRKTKEVALQHKWKSGKHRLLGQLSRETELLWKEIHTKKSLLEKSFRDDIENELGLKPKVVPNLPLFNVSNPGNNPVVRYEHSLAESTASEALVQLSSPIQHERPFVPPVESSAIPKMILKKEVNSPVKRKAAPTTDSTPSKRSKATKKTTPVSSAEKVASPSKVVRPKSPQKSPVDVTPILATTPKAPVKKLYCVCQTPYDASRFMVGCDGCHNWFHGDCIGINEDMVEDIDVWTCTKCQEEEQAESNVSNGVIEEEIVQFESNGISDPSEIVDGGELAIEVSSEVSIDSSNVKNESINQHSPTVAGQSVASSSIKQEELFCLCRRAYDESQFYICCDSCQDWFHGRCVGVLPMEAATIEEYVCPNCMKDSKINHANLKQLDVVDMVNLRQLLAQIKGHKSAWPFLQPVDAREVPDYYKVIKEPMDLKKVEQKITNNRYTKLAQFIGDMTKIFDNCRYYNDRKSPFYACAESLESYFVAKIKSFRDNMS